MQSFYFGLQGSTWPVSRRSLTARNSLHYGCTWPPHSLIPDYPSCTLTLGLSQLLFSLPGGLPSSPRYRHVCASFGSFCSNSILLVRPSLTQYKIVILPFVWLLACFIFLSITHYQGHSFTCMLICLLSVVSFIECKLHDDRDIPWFYASPMHKRVSHWYMIVSLYSCAVNEWVNEWAFPDYSRDTVQS